MSDGEKGSSFEFLVAAYFQAYGYLVRRDVGLASGSGTAEVTDVDVLGIRFMLPLAEERLVVDCKDRRKSRPFERILWTLGTSRVAAATRTVVALPKVPWQARDLAWRYGVDIVDEEHLRLPLEKLGYHGFGAADQQVWRLLSDCRARANPDQKDLVRRHLDLTQVLITGHPLTNFNRLISFIGYVGRAAGDGEPSWLQRYACYDAAVLCSIALVKFVTECKWAAEGDWMDYARKKLTYGDLPPAAARQLATLAIGPQYAKGLPSPEYQGEALELIRALMADQNMAAVVPYALDYLLLGELLAGRAEQLPYLGSLQEPALKTARRVLSVLEYCSGFRFSRKSVHEETGLQGTLPGLGEPQGQ